jgi:hypothetical protein
MNCKFDKSLFLNLLVGTFFIQSSTIFAQNEERIGNISGSIRDKNTQEVLIGATGQPVKVDGSNAIPFILDNPSGAGVPTIGLIYEF